MGLINLLCDTVFVVILKDLLDAICRLASGWIKIERLCLLRDQACPMDGYIKFYNRMYSIENEYHTVARLK